MNANRIALAGVVAALALAVAGGAGCSKKTRDTLVPNLRPTVRLTAAPYDTSRATPYFYAYRMNWVGNDPDGRVEYFLYAIDPPETPGTPVSWQRTVRSEEIIFFTADSSSKTTNQATRPHIFALCAVDDRGDTSDVVKRGFYSYTECPSVTITAPRPNSFFALSLTPSVRVEWTGQDRDGQLTTKPVHYKYILLSSSSRFPVDLANTRPDSLRNYYAYYWKENGLSKPWDGWTDSPADTTNAQFLNLTPDQQYMFVVVGFDEAGAFSPIFDRTQNMLLFKPGFASTLGPKITVFNEFMVKEFKGGYTIENEFRVEVPAGQRVTFNWVARPDDGALIESYRWKLALDPFDETERTDQNDVVHWSEPSVNTISCTVGPFEGGKDTLLLIEAKDNNTLASLAVIRMQVVKSDLNKPLLVVNDTRLIGGQVHPTLGCLVAATGSWPVSAELDTFLVSRSSVPWTMCTATGSQLVVGMTEPGIFAGYDFEVVRTRTPAIDKSTNVRLSTLGQYKNIVWIVDGQASGPTNSQNYALRYMAGSGHVNTLGTYVRQGGRVWLAGGGGSAALCRDLGNSSTNDGFTFVYSNRILTELQPGRFMYDVTHWRSEIQVYTVTAPAIKKSSRAVGGWTDFPVWGGGTVSAPDYNFLPASLDAKTPATDNVPATRTSNPSSFYRSVVNYSLEYLTQPNFILEDIDPDPTVLVERAALDTLYRSESFILPGGPYYERGGPGVPGSIPGVPVMTYYHGLEAKQFVFSGFDLWNYQKPQLVALVDFVLQRIFGLTKTPIPAASAGVVRGAPPAWSPPAAAARSVSLGRSVPGTAARDAASRPESRE